MDIYFIRHGQTDWNAAGKMQGQTDIPLNETGIAEAHASKNKVDALVFDAAYSSTLRRAMHTAEIMLGDKKHKLTHDHRLMERNYGAFEGTHYEEYERMGKTRSTFHPEKGESREQFIGRIRGFIDEMYGLHHNQSIVIFSHGGVYRALLAALFDLTWEQYKQYKIHNCDVRHIRLSAGKAQLLEDGKVILETPWVHKKQ
jgi:broad specificity phosphatase PhoE